MEKIDVTWKIFSMYMLIIFFMLLCSGAFAQIKVTHFNAGWNKANDVKWLNKLSDCDITKVDIVKKPKQQTKHKIVVVSTIIIFKDGEEVKRYQADLSFKIIATKEDLQEYIDELLMEDF